MKVKLNAFLTAALRDDEWCCVYKQVAANIGARYVHDKVLS
jgi:hypothetical protein